MDIAKRIKELRLEKNLTQLDVAKEIGATRAAISFWELGVNEPKAIYIYRLAKFFNVSSDYLLGLSENL